MTSRGLKLFLLVFAFLNLVVGMLAGLGRMGWAMPMSETVVHHGAIMVGGFLGSLIALEKIIPLKRRLFFIGPMMSASSIVVFALGNFQAAIVMLLFASALFIMVYAAYLQKQYDFNLVLAMVGALCWLIGNALLLWKRFYPMAFPWWMGFLLFTIVSERLELSKFLPVTRQRKNLLQVFLGLFLAAVLLPFHGSGTYLAGLSMVLISIWLMRYDMIRITIKKEGLVRYTAIALLCGYTALLMEGIFLIALHNTPLAYDVIVHTFFLGFVFMMIFAHGPIILPGVLGLSVKPYHPLLYVPLATLLLSLVIRTSADVTFLSYSWRTSSGWMTLGGILLYFILMLVFTLRELRNSKT